LKLLQVISKVPNAEICCFFENGHIESSELAEDLKFEFGLNIKSKTLSREEFIRFKQLETNIVDKHIKSKGTRVIL